MITQAQYNSGEGKAFTLTTSASRFESTKQPLLLVVLAGSEAGRRVTLELQSLRLPYIQVQSAEEAVQVHTVVGEQIVGVVTEHQVSRGMDGSALLARIEARGRRLPTLLIGTDWTSLESAKRNLAPGSDFLLHPAAEDAWSSRIKGLQRWMRPD